MALQRVRIGRGWGYRWVDPTTDPANYKTVISNVVTPVTRYRNWTETSSSITSSIVESTSIPYMRASPVRCLVDQMRPYVRLYVLFDGADVTNLCRPLSEAEYNADSVGASSIGTSIYATAGGKAWFRFYLPKGRFTTGQKIITVTDSLSAASESTKSTAYYVANGTLQFSQPVKTVTNKALTESFVENVTTQVSSQVYVAPPEYDWAGSSD